MGDRVERAVQAAGQPSERGVAKLREQGKLPTRQRIALLVDPDTFVEDGLLANALASGLPAE